MALSVLGFAVFPSTSAGSVQMRGSASTIEPVALRIEFLANPVGLDALTPRFSWKLNPMNPGARDLSQSAYRLIVASSATSLAIGKGDVWDSGKVSSRNFLEVHYGGRALESSTTYFWKLRVWDQAGKESPWSKQAVWTTALLHPSDWSAKWVAAEPDEPLQPQAIEHTGEVAETSTPLPIFRRDFHLDKPVKQAMVSVSGLGQYELHLNGRNITDTILNPGWTNYRKTVLYNTYNLTSLLHQGNNSLGMMLGRGMYDVPGVKGRYTKFIGSFGQPKMILQLDIVYVDGSQTRIVSDRSWKTTSGPITFSSIYGGEDFDARKERPGWDSPGFSDTTWSSAIEVAGPNGDQSNPGSELSGKIIPSVQTAQSFLPVKVNTLAPGIKVYDLGQNFSGWPEITVRGRPGSTIQLLPSDEVWASDGSHAPAVNSAIRKRIAALFSGDLREVRAATVFNVLPISNEYSFIKIDKMLAPNL
jgi:alpha-L-rhamnosidase